MLMYGHQSESKLLNIEESLIRIEMGLTKSNILLQYAINGLNLIGLCVSGYALAIEIYKEAYPDYKPFCDFSESVSCSAALMSK